MLINNRLIWKSGASLKDLSAGVNNINAPVQALNMVAATDYLYIGSDLPFNHRYFKFGTKNNSAGVISAEFWTGFAWQAAVDLTDQTSVSGKTFAQDGIINWFTERNHSWAKHSSTELMTGSGLETLKIYDLYWVRLTMSVNLDSGVTVNYMGHKFSDDNDLAGLYPDLVRTNVLTAFKAAKTTWDEQHLLAAEQIIGDLRRKQVLWNQNQIFGWEEFTDCAVHKVAEMAYAAFGNDYEKRRQTAREYYEDNLDKVVDTAIDKNEDGRLSEYEKRPSFGRLIRG